MDTMTEQPTGAAGATSVERTSEREVVVRRTIQGPPHLVFEAWTTPDLLMQWWTPPSFGITFVSCELDVRTGGTYRFVFTHPDFEAPMAFFGRYLEVVPNERIVWTNEESGDAGSISTLTLDAQGDDTLLVIHDAYPTTASLDEAMEQGAIGGYGEMFDQLDKVLASHSAEARQA